MSPPTRPRLPRQSAEEPLVIFITDLTVDAVNDVALQMRKLAKTRRVVIDVTGVRSFDSTGTTALLELQNDVGSDKLVVVGIRAATARLVGTADVVPRATPMLLSDSIYLHKLPSLVLLACDEEPTSDSFGYALDVAIAEDVAIVVVDMVAMPTPSAGLVDRLDAAGRQVAAHGQELVLINVSPTAAAALRRTGLPPTTYLAEAADSGR